MAIAINQMNRFLPSFIKLVVGIDSETEGSAHDKTSLQLELLTDQRAVSVSMRVCAEQAQRRDSAQTRDYMQLGCVVTLLLESLTTQLAFQSLYVNQEPNTYKLTTHQSNQCRITPELGS